MSELSAVPGHADSLVLPTLSANTAAYVCGIRLGGCATGETRRDLGPSRYTPQSAPAFQQAQLPERHKTSMINFSAVIVLVATIVIIVTRGELGRVKAATASESGSRG